MRYGGVELCCMGDQPQAEKFEKQNTFYYMKITFCHNILNYKEYMSI